MSKKFFDGEAELSDDEHAVDDDSADEEGEKSDEDLDEDLAESEEAGTSADEVVIEQAPCVVSVLLFRCSFVPPIFHLWLFHTL